MISIENNSLLENHKDDEETKTISDNKIKNLKDAKIIDDKFQVVRKISGNEGYSKIYIVRDINTEELLVIKAMKTLYARSPLNRHFIENERNSLRRVDHQNVIKFISNNNNSLKISTKNDLVKKKQSISYLAMEYSERGDFFDLIRVTKGLDEELSKFYFKQLIEGLEAVHGSGICHRDIKLENLLLDRELNLKIADFEFATEYKDLKTMEYLKLKDKLGSDKYMAPEIHFAYNKDRFYLGDKIDIFSAGIVYLAFLSGTLFFEKTNSSDYKFRLFTENIQKFLKSYLTKKHISDDSIDLLEKMLNPNYEERISIEEIKNHNVFTSATEIEQDYAKKKINLLYKERNHNTIN